MSKDVENGPLGPERVSLRGLIAFLLICFGFSWGLWALMILSARHMLPFSFPTLPFGAFGPAVAAISVLLFRQGKKGLSALLRQLLQWRERGGWYLFAVFSTAAVYLLSCAAYILITRTRIPALENLGRWYLIFPLGLYVILFGGPLWEEIGWRGYLLPGLQQRVSPLTSSLIVGLIWATWHVPGFYLEGSPQQGTSFAPFYITMIAISILFTWVYNGTRGSLFVVVVYHFFTNMTSVILGLTVPSLLDAPLQNRIFVGVVCALALGVALLTKGSLGTSTRRPASPEQPRRDPEDSHR